MRVLTGSRFSDSKPKDFGIDEVTKIFYGTMRWPNVDRSYTVYLVYLVCVSHLNRYDFVVGS